MRHEKMLTGNPRTIMQVRNLKRLDEPERARIREQAEQVRTRLT
jgi:deoxyribodipyrimidine photolyase-like uncharacterized protein